MRASAGSTASNSARGPEARIVPCAARAAAGPMNTGSADSAPPRREPRRPFGGARRLRGGVIDDRRLGREPGAERGDHLVDHGVVAEHEVHARGAADGVGRCRGTRAPTCASAAAFAAVRFQTVTGSPRPAAASTKALPSSRCREGGVGHARQYAWSGAPGCGAAAGRPVSGAGRRARLDAERASTASAAPASAPPGSGHRGVRALDPTSTRAGTSVGPRRPRRAEHRVDLAGAGLARVDPPPVLDRLLLARARPPRRPAGRARRAPRRAPTGRPAW
jgi:hypothetical protein